MNPGSGTDVAQTIQLGDSEEGGRSTCSGTTPTTSTGPTYGPAVHRQRQPDHAHLLADLHLNATVGQVGKQVQFRTDGVPSGATDLVLDVTDPDGNSTGEIDTGTSPEA